MSLGFSHLVFHHNVTSELFFRSKVSRLAEGTEEDGATVAVKVFSVADEAREAPQGEVAAAAGPSDSLGPQVTRQSGRAFGRHRVVVDHHLIV